MWKGSNYPRLSWARLAPLGSTWLCGTESSEMGQAGLILQEQVGWRKLG